MVAARVRPWLLALALGLVGLTVAAKAEGHCPSWRSPVDLLATGDGWDLLSRGGAVGRLHHANGTFEELLSSDGASRYHASPGGEIVAWSEQPPDPACEPGPTRVRAQQVASGASWTLANESALIAPARTHVALLLRESDRVIVSPWGNLSAGRDLPLAYEPTEPWPLPVNLTPSRVHAMALSDDGEWLAVATREELVVINVTGVSLVGRSSLRALDTIADLDFSADGRALAVLTSSHGRFSELHVYRIWTSPDSLAFHWGHRSVDEGTALDYEVGLVVLHHEQPIDGGRWRASLAYWHDPWLDPEPVVRALGEPRFHDQRLQDVRFGPHLLDVRVASVQGVDRVRVAALVEEPAQPSPPAGDEPGAGEPARIAAHPAAAVALTVGVAALAARRAR